jgi:hypothetical protein
MKFWSRTARYLFAGVLVFGISTAGLSKDVPILMRGGSGGAVYTSRSVSETEAVNKSMADSTSLAAVLVQRIMELQLNGPISGDESEGCKSFFPENASLDSVELIDRVCIIKLTLSPEFLEAVEEFEIEEIGRWLHAVAERIEGVDSIRMLVRPSADQPYQSLDDLLPEPGLPSDKPGVVKLATSEPEAPQIQVGPFPVRGQGQPQGALTGASVFLSPGHGWYYSSTLSRWATQRGNTNGIIEDLSNGEAVLQYLCQYLWNAGARVYTCRERDLQTNMVIVDTESASFSGSWTEVTGSGYDNEYRYAATTTGSPTASATFTPAIPVDGYYAVYVYYRTASSNTTTDARFVIHHMGGTTTWIQNQTRDGFTWKYVGTYYFEAGSSASAGSVVIDNQSATSGNNVVADAVRFGGGMGDYVDGGSTSGEPRWEESGKYYSGFMGNTYADGTVWAMPRFADWECEDSWEGNGGATNHNNAVYVSWHTNAPNPASGTSSFAFAGGLPGGAFGNDTDFTGVPGGLELRNAIHNELINDIRAGWDAGWTNRGTYTANFGELNINNNDDMPAALTEIAFHDTPSDAENLKEPDFRRLAARAVYQGIVKFYHSYYYLSEGNAEFNDDTLLPETPTNFRAINNGTGGVVLSWNAPISNSGDGLLGDPATGYRVYRSSNGKGFDNGSTVAGTSTTINGLAVGDVVYFRVSATNPGGESFPTETLGVRVTASGTPAVLIVNGFDRLDKNLNVIEDDPYSANALHRGFLWRMNTFDYVIQHAESLDAYGADFDSCSNEAVINGQVSLGDYEVVVWIVGEESTADSTFNATEQSLVTTYLTSNGGNLFVSGSEIGWDLDYQANGVSFYQGTLFSDYAGDDANTYAATGTGGGIFSAISGIDFDPGNGAPYDANYPDQITPLSPAAAALTYSGGSGGTAAIQVDTGSYRVVNLGFPFETITSATTRNQVMSAAMDFLGAPRTGVPSWILF